MRITVTRLREYLDSSLWFIPACFAIAAIILAQILLRLDERVVQQRVDWLFEGGPDSARALLSSISSSLITFTGLVFSVTMLVLQLTSSQFSPRVLRNFLGDRTTQLALGTFVATFTYALLVLRAVRSDTELEFVSAFVPQVSISVAFVLVLLSIAMFIHFINHMAQSIRAVTIISRVAGETHREIERMYPQQSGIEPEQPVRPPAGPPSLVLMSPGPPGVVTQVDEQRLLEVACRSGSVLVKLRLIGEFVPEGAPLFQIWGALDQGQRDQLEGSVVFGAERSMRQDPAFGLRQLVDIAERALSPGINDPTTAVQALDQLHDLLRRLATRGFPSPARLDGGGALRLLLPRPDWDTYVRLAVDEIRQYGEGSVQIARRLRTLLDDLTTVAPPHRQAVLNQQLALLDQSIERGFNTALERTTARRPITGD